LVGCVGCVVVPGVSLFYMWSVRIERRAKPEVVCFDNLRLIDGAEQTWALENHKTTNDTPRWTDLTGYLRNTKIAWPIGDFYTLARISEPPTCSIPDHATRYANRRPQAWTPGQ